MPHPYKCSRQVGWSSEKSGLVESISAQGQRGSNWTNFKVLPDPGHSIIPWLAIFFRVI